ncbi:protein adenylyltransferase SelO family protein [Corynebacterium pelargi]|uniref:Protein nucleotidyltransferase YdiU n=1 Tax=Corynebacterium pelargi TaxID=1471400 RepID=A0A410W864_9CORY|nr:protein adenylyltransferase SelO family protein [Corynebacterium pelargi]QAU52147.1 hypothetical protein CPELA_04340 [Corynebacterium pelargi]GGG69812.1 UPF0061 protein [Corynebacterium pelargi]
MLSHSFATALPNFVSPWRVEAWPDAQIKLLNPDFQLDDAALWQLLKQEGHAQAYAGHQFGQFVPMLGDGRAVLLGDIATPDGTKEVHVKGSGPTPYSRRGDGKAQLGPVLREYLMSEFMHAVGIPTTRGLAVITTGETIARQTLQPGAVLLRVADSHLRVGTFQLAAIRGREHVLEVLRYSAQVLGVQADTDAALAEALLLRVMQLQATLVAQWMRIGFVHGVMNTDNCSITGETLDYGPCAFIDRFDGNAVFSSIDQQGRYSFGNQPHIAAWNMVRLAECFVGILEVDALNELVQQFPQLYRNAWIKEMALVLGLEPSPEAEELLDDLLVLLQHHNPDYHSLMLKLRNNPESADQWLQPWIQRWQALDPDRDMMRQHMPNWIPRNHIVEQVIQAALRQDWDVVREHLGYARDPFNAPVAKAPENPAPYVTYCGT